MMVRANSSIRLMLPLAVMMLAAAGAMAQSNAAAAATRPVGTVKSITGNNIVLTPDAGPDVNVVVQDSARLLRIAPGETDLKNAAPLSLTDLQAGDRIRVRGNLSDDGKTLLAVSVIAMKKADVTQRQQKELQDWQKRGAGGLVKSVNPATGVVEISVSGLGTSKELTVKTAKNTAIRRYSEDSIKYDDAKPSTLAQVKAGDQLRARGDKNADNTEITADEVVFGSFRNIAGLVTNVDAEKNTITVNDLTTKKPVTIHIAKDSQMHKLPQMAAMMIAARLKGIAIPGMGGATPGAQGANPAAGGAQRQQAPGGQAGPGGAGAGQGGGAGAGAARMGGGGSDLQQILNRMPAMQFSEFQKGDAVMIVTTEGTADSVTAITLLSGVEPILTASPNGMGAASLLSPWNLGASPGDAGGIAP